MRPLTFILIFLLSAPVAAGVHKDIGFTRLQAELGNRLPTGQGISVAQVESAVAGGQSADAGSPEIRTWMPNIQVPDLQPYRLVDRSGAPRGVYSGHATAVARRILGRGPGQGLASQIDLYEVYSVLHWLGAGMLRGNTGLAPVAGPLRVVNHSWASNTGDSRILRRSDWLTNRDEIIHVVGVRNAEGKKNFSLMAAAVNAIVVGRSDGKHSISTEAIDDVYVDGRSRPHLVAPLNTGSAAAPTVTSAVIVLLQTAGNPSLSTRPEPIENRGGERIYDAGRSEVIRAVLMAAADHKTDNGGRANITSYRGTAVHRTDNGLDTRYGAGQLNIYNAWQILNAGEREQSIGDCGFDYEPGLAGRGNGDASDGIRQYSIAASASTRQLTTTLSWNLLFPTARFDLSAVLNDLDLSLYEIGTGGERLLHSSNSRIDTTETIRAILMPGKRYRLVVSRVDQGVMAQDYAIAWHMDRGSAGQ